MNKLNISLENCYGIKELDYKFDFRTKSTYVIYAPNGTMKTSLAKTFMDFTNNLPSKDLVFSNRETVRKIINEDGDELNPEEVFVIEPYNHSFKSSKISTLLVNKGLKEQYDKIHSDINEKKDILLGELQSMSGVKKGIEETISTVFTTYPNEFFKSLLRVKTEVLEDGEPEFSDILYSKVFGDKIIAFLNTKDFKEKLQEYIGKYDELIDSSTYFRRGIFNHNNASVIAKNLKDNGFFKANHSVSLNSNNTEAKIITTEQELEEVIKQEKETILNDPDLAKAFEDIDNKLRANVELRSFRDYLLNNIKILPELPNIEGLKQKVWISYLKEHKELFSNLESEYSKGKEEIEKIVNQAKLEETDWRDVIDIFNKRFSVPFKLKVGNQEDVILKSEGPNIEFEFVDYDDKSDVNEGDLLKILSNGEKRALYILNIIFEVQARKKDEQETVFIVDDIADSFDYKNKYAIIEYLKDISEYEHFNQIVLSHNYDFYRTISSRLDMGREHKLTTVKTESKIILKEEKYQNNPFSYWKKHLDEQSMMIASIPFIRNIAEFTGDADNFLKLTSFLHIKTYTENYLVSDLEIIYKEVIKDINEVVLPEQEKKVIDIIYEIADSISVNNDEIIELENKIVLAMAIRLKAEEYMIQEINNSVFIESLENKKNQTFKLYNKFKEIFPKEVEKIELLEQVNLMTPENIHVNSFMYEPILDMDNKHLKTLFVTLKDLI